MTAQFQLGDTRVQVEFKDIRNVHLSVHPPQGRVSISAPHRMSLETVRLFAIAKLDWIRRQQKDLQAQEREPVREYLSRESHFVWGERYLLRVVEREAKPVVTQDHRRITLAVRPGSDAAKRAEVLNQWHRTLLHEAIPPLLRKWEPRLRVEVRAYFLQRMKTRWGSCNHTAGHIRLNTELVKKPRDLLEYVIVHELAHLREPTHNERFVSILNKHYPSWREARAELNGLPLGAEVWGE